MSSNPSRFLNGCVLFWGDPETIAVLNGEADNHPSDLGLRYFKTMPNTLWQFNIAMENHHDYWENPL